MFPSLSAECVLLTISCGEPWLEIRVMALLVVTGAMMSCTFGVAPATFIATGDSMVMASSMPAGTFLDNKPFANIPPFGMCTSLANPTVASATAAALGVLTPMPCIPAPAGPWIPGALTTMLKSKCALDSNCKLMCSYAGVISIMQPGQFTVTVS